MKKRPRRRQAKKPRKKSRTEKYFDRLLKPLTDEQKRFIRSLGDTPIKNESVSEGTLDKP